MEKLSLKVMWLVWSGGAGVLWLLSGSVLPGHLPRQDGNSNRARSTVRKISDSHHFWYQRRYFSGAKLRNMKLCVGQKQCSGFFFKWTIMIWCCRSIFTLGWCCRNIFAMWSCCWSIFCNAMMLLKYWWFRNLNIHSLSSNLPSVKLSTRLA